MKRKKIFQRKSLKFIIENNLKGRLEVKACSENIFINLSPFSFPENILIEAKKRFEEFEMEVDERCKEINFYLDEKLIFMTVKTADLDIFKGKIYKKDEEVIMEGIWE